LRRPLLVHSLCSETVCFSDAVEDASAGRVT
jgi:hypothetical protein